MAFVIFEPAILATLLAGAAQSAPAAPIVPPATPADPCASPSTTRAFDCCVDLAPWMVPPTAALNHLTPYPHGAADQKEGR